MIVSILKSPVKHKRYRAYIKKQNGQMEYYDFGLAGGQTFIDGRTEKERENYLKRHMGNKTEEALIKNLVPSPSLLSAFLLWGKSRDLNENVKYLNNRWNQKT
jgi:hypothetical protein